MQQTLMGIYRYTWFYWYQCNLSFYVPGRTIAKKGELTLKVKNDDLNNLCLFLSRAQTQRICTDTVLDPDPDTRNYLCA